MHFHNSLIKKSIILCFEGIDDQINRKDSNRIGDIKRTQKKKRNPKIRERSVEERVGVPDIGVTLVARAEGGQYVAREELFSDDGTILADGI